MIIYFKGPRDILTTEGNVNTKLWDTTEFINREKGRKDEILKGQCYLPREVRVNEAKKPKRRWLRSEKTDMKY